MTGDRDAGRLEISVLGPTEVRYGGHALALGKPQVGRVVTALALRHPAPTSREALEELMWPYERRPANPAQTLYTYVSNLRSALRRGTGHDRWIVSGPGSYGFATEIVALDRDRFDREVETGVGYGRELPATAVECFGRALGQWRGTPFASMDDALEAAAETSRLTTQRLGVLDARARIMLDAGAGTELVPGLETAVDENPLHERLVCWLAVSLYRSGRQQEALARLRALVHRLREDLGVDPTPETRAVERAILEHDHAVLEPAAVRQRVPDAQPQRPPVVARLEQEHFAGRTTELASLAAWWRSQTPVALVTGEPGIGKSRLAAHFVATTLPPSALVVWVTAAELGGGALVELARCLQVTAEARGTELTSLARDALAFLPDEGVDHDAADRDGAGVRRVGPRSRRPVLREVLAGLCTSLAASYDGLVLVVDDLQWADTTTLDVLDLIATSEPAGVRVLLIRRTSGAGADQPDVVTGWARTGAVVTIPVAGLTAEAVRELVAARSGHTPADLAARLAARLVSDTGGNAFYVTSVLGQVLEGRDTSLPTDVVTLVRSQLEALAPEDREVLHVASALGVTFSASMLAIAASRSLPEVNAVLARGATGGLLDASAEDGERWRHAIAREAVYFSLSPSVRTELHRVIAERLEAGSADDLDPVLLVLARHALLGERGRGARHAIVLAERAALLALECSLYEQAADLARGARALVTRPADPVVPALLLLELEAVLCAGQPDLVTEMVETHWTRFLRSAEPAQLAELVSYLDVMDYRESSARRILSVLPLVTGDREAHVRVLTTAAVSLNVAEPDRAQDLLQEAWDLAGAPSTIGERPRWDLLEASILIRWSLDSLETRRRLAADLAALAVGSSNLEIAVAAATFERIVGYECADLTLVDEATRRHQRLADQLRIPRYRAGARQRAAARLILEGRFAEAQRMADSVLEVSDDEAFVAGFGAQLVAIRIEQGRLGELEGLFQEYGPGLGGEGPWRATRILVLATTGRTAEARDEVDAMLGDGSATRTNLYLLTTLGILAMATAQTGDLAHARRLRTLLAPYAERVVVVSTAAVVWGAAARFIAPLDLLLGEPTPALDHATLALSIHERLGARPFIARDRLTLATALARRDDPGDRGRAHELALGAVRLAEHLGMRTVAADARLLAASLTGGKVPESSPS